LVAKVSAFFTVMGHTGQSMDGTDKVAVAGAADTENAAAEKARWVNKFFI
jgi:hypothetical protein